MVFPLILRCNHLLFYYSFRSLCNPDLNSPIEQIVPLLFNYSNKFSQIPQKKLRINNNSFDTIPFFKTSINVFIKAFILLTNKSFLMKN